MLAKLNNCYIVTGANGRIGHRLVKALCRRGASVVGHDRENFRLAALCHEYADNFTFVHGEFSEVEDQVKAALDALPSGKERVLLHLAGVASVKLCEEHPEEAFQSNVKFVFDVLEFFRKNQLNKAIFASSGTLYGDMLDKPATEDDPIISGGVYTATKIAGEALFEGYARTYGICSIIARISNIFMWDPPPGSVVRKIISAVFADEPTDVNALYPVRDFIYVDDVVDGFIRIGEMSVDPGTILLNLSTGKGHSIEDLAAAACVAAGRERELIGGPEVGADEQSKNILNPSKLEAMTGWRPKWEMSEALSEILNMGDYGGAEEKNRDIHRE